MSLLLKAEVCYWW